MKLESNDEIAAIKKFPSNENEKQKIRKEKNPSSRFLDNYYNPDLYSKSWFPNGVYKLKKKYIYSESGLCFHFEKNNTLQKRVVWEQEGLKTKLWHFLEYDYLEENDYLITIEYCANCIEHQTHTQHSSDLFRNFAVNLQKSIHMRFPFIRVLLKPIETDILMEPTLANAILNKTKIVEDKYKEVRIGAMEVQLCNRKKGEKNSNVILLHSKMMSKTWPSITNVLNAIVGCVPLITFEVKLYDRESKSEEANNIELKGLLDTKLEKIKVNVYKYKNSLIEEICKNSKDELDNFIDPNKRKTILSMKKSNKAAFSFYQSNGLTLTTPKNKSEINFSTNKSSHLETKDKQGELLISLYTDSKGIVTISNIPYDTYMIEVEESSYFQSTSLMLNFKEIESEKIIKKFIGIFKQQNSYLQVYVFKHNEKQEDQMISDTEVIINSLGSSSEEKLLFDEQETKVKLIENKSVSGRYEGIVVPGKYNLNITKTGYDLVRKQITLQPGENKVNIELNTEQNCSIKVCVMNYTNMASIENALIKLKFGNEEETIEGISNAQGFYAFETPMKEDFITVYVDKPGFLPGQRTYIRDAGKGKEINVILVKESMMTKENCIVMVTYSNLVEDNFEPVYLYSKNIGNYTDINCSDSQSDNGIITSFFKFHNPNSEEKDKLEEPEEELEEVVRLMFKIRTKRLKKEFKFNHNLTLNGLQRFSCECCVYTPHNIFFVNSPSFSREQEYEYWDIGFLDVKNVMFYEISLLTNDLIEKNLFFFDLTNFLQIIIDKKVYSKLFEIFEFDKGMFLNNDRFIHEPTFLRSLRKVTNDLFSPDFLLLVCDMMKANNKMISYSVFKKKISSILKNFREIMKLY